MNPPGAGMSDFPGDGGDISRFREAIPSQPSWKISPTFVQLISLLLLVLFLWVGRSTQLIRWGAAAAAAASSLLSLVTRAFCEHQASPPDDVTISTYALEKSAHVQKSYLMKFLSSHALKNPNVVGRWRLMSTKSSCNSLLQNWPLKSRSSSIIAGFPLQHRDWQIKRAGSGKVRGTDELQEDVTISPSY